MTTNTVFAALHKHYQNARKRQMGSITAFVFVILQVFAYTFLRLEGPAWQGLWQRYEPWFKHLTLRPYKPADPLRYVLQVFWLVFVRVPAGKTVWLFEGLKKVWFTVLRERRFMHKLLSRQARPAIAQSCLRHLFSNPRHLFSHIANKRLKMLAMFIFAAVVVLLAMLLVTQPFSLLAQFIFVVLLWGAAMLVRRIPGRFSSLLLIVLSLTVSARYIWWRYTSTLNWNSKLDLFFGVILLAAETYSWVVLVMGYIQTAWPLDRKVASLPVDRTLWPTVDLMIPTYNEDLSVIKPTVFAALGMDWPADKLRIHLLDDGRREEMRAFAEQAGIGYIIRPDGRHAKAGNLNNALKHTSADLVAVFDCDHVPSRSFLQLTVGWFLRDEKLALVQTPHHFFSPDPFERNLGHFGKQPNENALFYGLIQDGNDLWNAAFFCGSCAVLRRSAVESIGGFAVETVTEDAHTALRLHRNGYNSAYLRIPMAAGLATESLSAHIGQRIRWARGMAQIFRTDNPLLGKGLGLFQRLCYLNAMLHFLAGVPRIIYLVAPLAFLLLHSYIIYAPAIAIMLYVLPHMIHASLTNSITQGAYRRTFWGEIYETVLSWYIARPTTVALFSPNKGSFNVTAKGGLIEHEYFDWKMAKPYVILAVLNFLGMCFGIWRLLNGPADEQATVIITMLWVVYNLIVLGAAVGVAAEVRQTRHSHRITTSLSADVIDANGYMFTGTLTDYSDAGVGMKLTGNAVFQVGALVDLILVRGARQFSFPGRISRCIEDNIGIHFEALSKQQQIDFVQCTFARADAWMTHNNDFSLDRPMQSFADVVLLSLSGYQHLAKYLPFPLSWLVERSTRLVVWVLSFLPRSRPIIY